VVGDAVFFRCELGQPWVVGDGAFQHVLMVGEFVEQFNICPIRRSGSIGPR
jgi:hypothetical protein